MASIWRTLGNTFRRLRWKLTLSYTAVTISALLVVVLVQRVLLFSTILVSQNLLNPEVWVRPVQQNTPPAWNHVPARSPVDTENCFR